MNRLILGNMLERLGVDVAFAEDGQECLVHLSEEPAPDAIFLDLQMPGMDGRTAVEKIRSGEAGEAVASIPIAVVSAERFGGKDVERFEIQETMLKPVDSAKLEAFVNRVRGYNSSGIALAR